MSTVTPPPPPPPPVAQAGAPPTAVVSNPPAALSSVAAGTRIDAIIVATTPDGRVEVETKLGRFLMQPSVTLPKDGPIQLQVQTLARHLFLAITSIHGKQPAAALRGLGLAGAGGLQAGNTAATAIGNAAGTAQVQSVAGAPTQLTAGATVTATVLKPVKAASTPPRGLAGQASAASAARGGPASTQGAAAAGSPAGTTTAGQTGGRAGAVSGAQAAAAYGGQSAARIGPAGPVVIPSANAFSVRITSVQAPPPGSPPPTAPIATAANLTPGQSVNGIVSASPTPTSTVVQTHAGPVSLAVPTTVPAGTAVQLQVLNALPAAKRVGLMMLQARQWPALEDTFQALRENNPQAALQLINSALPRPDSALAANILQFFLGIRAGDMAAMMGDAPLRALQATRPDLLNRLRDDALSLGRLADEPVSGEWRAMPVPMASGAEIQQIQMLMRRLQRDEEDEEENAGPGTRFIVDVDLSRMGRLQLDGYVQDGAKRFDLIIRSEARLADNIQADIRAIFEDAGEITGMKGGVSFQAAPPKFVDVVNQGTLDDLGLVV